MKESLIYIYPTNSSFIEKDIKFLSKKYNVKTPKHNWGNKKRAPLNFIFQFVFLLRNIVSCRAVFVMFGGYWSFLPAVFGKLFNKRVFVILGGSDCVSFPHLGYGSLRKPILRSFIKWSYILSDKLLPVDESLVYSRYNYDEESTHKCQGYNFFFPEISTPYKVIHYGFDPLLFTGSQVSKKPNTFITVAAISSMVTFKLKGIDLMIELAKLNKNCKFTVIGISENITAQLKEIPGNVTFFPFLSANNFKQYLFESEFVLQLSISEGFPNALCEGMLCKCIPIGSAVAAIPNIIKNTGFIMESSKIEYLQAEFAKILKLSEHDREILGSKARNRIIETFPILKREQAFLDLLDG